MDEVISGRKNFPFSKRTPLIYQKKYSKSIEKRKNQTRKRDFFYKLLYFKHLQTYSCRQIKRMRRSFPFHPALPNKEKRLKILGLQKITAKIPGLLRAPVFCVT
jgi:hypothetical protein